MSRERELSFTIRELVITDMEGGVLNAGQSWQHRIRRSGQVNTASTESVRRSLEQRFGVRPVTIHTDPRNPGTDRPLVARCRTHRKGGFLYE